MLGTERSGLDSLQRTSYAPLQKMECTQVYAMIKHPNPVKRSLFLFSPMTSCFTHHHLEPQHHVTQPHMLPSPIALPASPPLRLHKPFPRYVWTIAISTAVLLSGV